MEKQTPHCKLSIVKTMIESGNVRTTKAAREGGTALGFDFDSMIAVIMALTPADFYKSMRPSNLAGCLSPHYAGWRDLS